VILREIQAAGYIGGITVLKDYIHPKRVLRSGRATVRSRRAGAPAADGLGEITRPIAGVNTEIHFIVNTLSYSRRFHFWCTDSEDAEHTYEGLVRGFEYFGGWCARCWWITRRSLSRAPARGTAEVQSALPDLAGHYGFAPRAARPNRARTKGKDERNVGYIKHNFFMRYREFESWEHLNQLASAGCRGSRPALPRHGEEWWPSASCAKPHARCSPCAPVRHRLPRDPDRGLGRLR